MRIAKFISVFGMVAMTGILIYGLIVGDFGYEGSQLLQMPWGIVSMVDLYIGFTLFSGWIAFREKSLARSIFWIFLMMTLGFFTGSLYTFLALQKSNGDWKKFWLGNRASEIN